MRSRCSLRDTLSLAPACTWSGCLSRSAWPADGGYGGSDTNYKYSFILPDTWKTDTVSKVDKATNGTDARFVDPKNKEGARRLARVALL